jgi:hypothetical protein
LVQELSLTSKCEGSVVNCPLHRQYTIKMIDLVLQEFREISFKCHALLLPILIPICNPTPLMPMHLNEEFGKTHAVIPEVHHFRAFVMQHRV